MVRALLSLGSNLEPETHLRAAVAELRDQFGEILVSQVYRTEAVGFDGPAFLNLAVALDTHWTPQQLDTWLHALEDRHGRRRDVPRYSSRTLDVDIVLFGDLVVRGPGHSKSRATNSVTPSCWRRSRYRTGCAASVSGQSMAELWRAHPEHALPLKVDNLD